MLLHPLLWNPNWPSQYTYPGRYEDTGVTNRVFEYATKTSKKHLKIFDVGCSDGIAAKTMQNNLLDYGISTEIIGNDIHDGRRKEAEENLHEFILGDILKIQSKPEFDIVICSKMIFFESAKRKTTVLSKCSEFLKQEGGLITDAHNYDSPTISAQIKEYITDIKKIFFKLKFGLKASYHEMNRIKEFRFKRRVKLISGRSEALEYSNEILTRWNKLDLNTKFSFRLDTFLARFSAHINKNPNHKKHGKKFVAPS